MSSAAIIFERQSFEKVYNLWSRKASNDGDKWSEVSSENYDSIPTHFSLLPKCGQLKVMRLASTSFVTGERSNQQRRLNFTEKVKKVVLEPVRI